MKDLNYKNIHLLNDEKRRGVISTVLGAGAVIGGAALAGKAMGAGKLGAGKLGAGKLGATVKPSPLTPPPKAPGIKAPEVKAPTLKLNKPQADPTGGVKPQEPQHPMGQRDGQGNLRSKQLKNKPQLNSRAPESGIKRNTTTTTPAANTQQPTQAQRNADLDKKWDSAQATQRAREATYKTSKQAARHQGAPNFASTPGRRLPAPQRAIRPAPDFGVKGRPMFDNQDLNYNNIPLLNEKEKKEKGILGKALDVAVPVAAGALAYKAMGSKPSPTSVGASVKPSVPTPYTPTPGAKAPIVGRPDPTKFDSNASLKGLVQARSSVTPGGNPLDPSKPNPGVFKRPKVTTGANGRPMIDGKPLTPEQSKQYTNKHGDFKYSEWNKKMKADSGQHDANRDRVSGAFNKAANLKSKISDMKMKTGAFEDPPKTPNIIPPKDTPSVIRRSNYGKRGSTSLEPLNDPTGGIKREPYKNPMGTKQTNRLGQEIGLERDKSSVYRNRGNADKNPNTIGIRAKPDNPAIGPQRTGKKPDPVKTRDTGAPFKPKRPSLGYEPTPNPASQTPKARKMAQDLKNAKKLGNAAINTGLGAASIPLGGAGIGPAFKTGQAAIKGLQKASPVIRSAGKKVIPKLKSAGRDVVNTLNAKVPGLNAASKIPYAGRLIPNTTGGVATTYAGGEVIGKGIDKGFDMYDKAQAAKVKSQNLGTPAKPKVKTSQPPTQQKFPTKKFNPDIKDTMNAKPTELQRPPVKKIKMPLAKKLKNKSSAPVRESQESKPRKSKLERAKSLVKRRRAEADDEMSKGIFLGQKVKNSVKATGLLARIKAREAYNAPLPPKVKSQNESRFRKDFGIGKYGKRVKEMAKTLNAWKQGTITKTPDEETDDTKVKRVKTKK